VLFQISDILEILKLRESKDTKTQHLSGGETKRLSIGIELITNPQIMFFDEPTSGLDSTSAMQIMSHLKHLATEGDRIVICVIHSPNSRVLSLFDDLYALAGGRCFYSGSLEEMVPTFEHFGMEFPGFYNRADFGKF
jgi:ABC-type multidrug transport system ATPase subunit